MLELTNDNVTKAFNLKGLREANCRIAMNLVFSALEHLGITDWNNKAAALATIFVETGDFECREENGPPSYFAKYDGRASLGNTQPGDGHKFRGRGYIQLTGRDNYTTFGPLVGEDLVMNPGLALHPPVAALIFAQYWKRRGCVEAAAAGNWERVRMRVNGGSNGMGKFKDYLRALGAET